MARHGGGAHRGGGKSEKSEKSDQDGKGGTRSHGGRSIWSGAISFGIVNIPVKLFPAVRDRSIHFHQISEKHKRRIRYRKVAEGHDDEVPADDIVKGFELSKGRYVIVEEKEFQQLAAKKSRAIEIVDFVKLSEIDPLFFEQPYYVVPDEKAGRSYRLLFDALERADKVAIAQFVMRSKEYLVAVRPVGGLLCLETMRYADEIVRQEDLGAGAGADEHPHERELKIAEQLVDSMTVAFDASRYKDQYRERVMDFIDKKAKGEGVEAIDEEWDEGHEQQSGKVLDLMAALEASLSSSKARKAGAGAAPRADDGDAAPSARARKHADPAEGKGRNGHGHGSRKRAG